MNIVSFTKTVIRHFEIQALIRRGIKTDRHIVVFESDDWGSIRMPSSQARDRLLGKGVKLKAPNTYDRVDTLASDDDLSALMEVLDSVRDKNGNPALMTLNCVVANPDFQKIWDVVSEEEFDILFPDRKNLLACGRVDQWEIKGFDLLIKAFAGIAKSFPNWFLDIAGKGSDKSVSILKGIAKEYGIEDRIRFLGFQTDVREVMKSHAIFVLSS